MPLAQKLPCRVDSASSALAGLDDAIGAVAKQLTDTERALAEEQDRAVRMAASAKLGGREVAAITSATRRGSRRNVDLAGRDLENCPAVRFDALAQSRDF